METRFDIALASASVLIVEEIVYAVIWSTKLVLLLSSEAKVLLEVINPAVLNSSRVPVTPIAALLPVLVFTSTPSVSDHDAS